ncbi:hypothetical protein RE6C_04673 [Rhodopirellula europaea 6C]|uniref:Uncharacterized protein n=2 Tax=Rhodopirellula TaxID=265488 RepID=M2APE8_9BACT|nr:hypothetical protein RE6C_04673 [Rhodopirellula europaea 6C]
MAVSNEVFVYRWSLSFDAMSNWVQIVTDVRAELGLGDCVTMPKSAYRIIAKRCGPDEIADVKQRLSEISVALEDVPDWDGDVSDDIYRAKELFQAVLDYAEQRARRSWWKIW